MERDISKAVFWGDWGKFETVINALTLVNELRMTPGTDSGNNQEEMKREEVAPADVKGDAAENDHVSEEEKSELLSRDLPKEEPSEGSTANTSNEQAESFSEEQKEQDTSTRVAGDKQSTQEGTAEKDKPEAAMDVPMEKPPEDNTSLVDGTDNSSQQVERVVPEEEPKEPCATTIGSGNEQIAEQHTNDKDNGVHPDEAPNEKEEETDKVQATEMTELTIITNRDGSSEETKSEESLESKDTPQKDEKEDEEQKAVHKLKGMPERRPTTFPPHLDSDDGQAHLLVLLSSQDLSKKQMTHQSRAILFLKVNHVPYTEIDGADYHNHSMRHDLFDVSGLRGKYPQFFIQQKGKVVFWGDWKRFKASNENGTLKEDLNKAIQKGVKDGEGKKLRVFESKTTEQPKSKISTAEHKKKLPPSKDEQRVETKHLIEDSAVKDEVEPSEKAMDSEVEKVENSSPNMAAPAGAAVATMVSTGAEKAVQPEESVLMEQKNPELLAEEVMLADLDSESPIPQDASSNRHICNISSELSAYAKPLMWENALVGISIKGFDIGSSQGPLADKKWYKETGNHLEELAQSRSMPRPCRHICLPGTVYPMAHVAVEGNGYWLIWDANEALEEWAKCHQEIAIHSRNNYNGVAVMRAKDTKYWEEKRKHGKYQGLPSIFHYDWSFSTPFCDKVEGGSWHEMAESGLKLSLLSDSSLPVLFYDEVVMYEDDIHNNGQIHYSVKIRVTPSYSYVLSRLWVCVDKVMVRLRESRVMLEYTKPVAKVYRDVNWRECMWSELPGKELPTDAEFWHLGGKETLSWQKRLKSLPECSLPKGMPKYAALKPF